MSDSPQQKQRKKIGRPARKPVSSEVQKQLENLYYRQHNFFGRERLFDLAKRKKIQVSRRQLFDWLSSQELHQLYAPSRKRKTIKATVVKRPFNQVGIDLIDMTSFEHNGYKYALTAIDLFSKKGWAKSLKSKDEDASLSAIKALLAAPGFKKTHVLRSDNGAEFKNEKVARFLASKGVKQVFSSADTPQANGAIERFNRTVKGLVRRYISYTDKIDWPTQIKKLIDNYNNTRHETTGKVPNAVAGERSTEALNETEKRLRRAVAKRGLPTAKPKFKVGDLVRIREDTEERPRLAFTFSREIYEVAQVVVKRATTQAASYRLADPDTAEFLPGLYYDADLLKVRNREAANPIKTPKVYEISRLEEPVLLNGQKAYIVRWRGYRRKIDLTPELRSQLLEDAPRIVRDYEREHQIDWRRARKV